MNSILITKLRDKNTSIDEFREVTEKLSFFLAHKVLNEIEGEHIEVETPLGTAKGKTLTKHIILVPVLRAGLVMLPSFLKIFPKSKIGLIGLKRNEKTIQADMYYDNLPQLSDDDHVIILDPMLATGNTLVKAVQLLIDRGVKQEAIIAVCMISAPEGIQQVKRSYPLVKLIVAQQDEMLTDNYFIYPGLGDFGDRYFGTLPDE